MEKIADLMIKLNEMDFDSHSAYKKYKTIHKMRSTTKVTIGGKETTAADADEVIKKQDKVKSGAPKADPKALDKLAKVGISKKEPKAYEPPKKADGSVDWDAIAKDPSNVHAKGSPQAGEDDDYFGDGDDTGERGTGITANDLKYGNVGDYDKSLTGEPKADKTPLSAKEKSPYGAKQKGIGAGSDNLAGPKDDADSISGDAKAERKVLEKLKSITKENDVDLCTIQVPGTNLFCAGNKQIPRDEMPQLKSTVIPGGKADKLVKAGKLDIDAKNGEVNTEDLFKSMLEREGIKMKDPEPRQVTSLKATQNQLVGSKVNMFAKVLAGDQPFDDKELDAEALQGFQDALREPIIISKDGYILDGHHRWAALVQHDIANGGSGDVEMDVKEVDMGATDLVDKTNKFTNDMGLATKAGGKKEKKEATMKLANIIKEEIINVLKEQYPGQQGVDDTIWNASRRNIKQNEDNVNEFTGRPIPMDTPNKFAYLDFKKYVYKKRGMFKKEMLKHIRKSDGQADGSKMFRTLSALWFKWAYHNNKEWTHIKDSLKFGRALMVMMVDDNLIFDKKAWKKDNRITHLKEGKIKTIAIWFEDSKGRFYRAIIDGKKRVKGWDSWSDAQDSLSKLLGWKIHLRSIDDRNLQKAANQLKKLGIKLTWDDSMDIS